MLFLEAIDKIHENEREKYSKDKLDNEFASYISIEPNSYSTGCQFLIQKREKSRLLIIEGKQRVYLSDVDIIHILLEMESKDTEWFISAMKNLYRGKGETFGFRIKEQTYEDIGIPQQGVRKALNLFSDSSIVIDDFVFVLNFIFSKDRCWESISKIKGFRNRSLVRYILLVEYYHNRSQWAKACLEKVGYPINKKSSDLNNDRRTYEDLKRIDNIDLIDIFAIK